MEETICEKAVQILQVTNDGNNLDPRHMSLIQGAVNGSLNDKGMAAFEELYKSVSTSHAYQKPPFHGVEHLTVDNEGYVYWKEIPIEHYSHPFSNYAREHAIKLGKCCRYLEHLRIPVNMTSAIWEWDKILAQHPGYKEFEAVTATSAQQGGNKCLTT